MAKSELEPELNIGLNKKIGLLWSLIGLTIVIWLVSGFLVHAYIDNWDNRGTFGDMFGAVNALFSGLAFAGLIYANVLQKKDLELQKKEISLNRAELKKSAAAQLRSEKALEQQVQEMRISSRLNALNTIISFYNSEIATVGHSEEYLKKVKEKRKAAILEIDELIDSQRNWELEDEE
ncbi:MAG: hypothetical protein H6607_11015 [Flavobacteriales bacterium]|nr:hypothetical protein [Flavobacteriales bacterium]